MSANRPIESSETYCDLLQSRAALHGDRPVYTFLRDGELDEHTYTYAELDQRAREIAGWLAGRSKPGDRVMLVFSQGLEYLASYFGCLYAGVIAVPAYPPRRNRRASRILSMVADADIRVALTTSALLEQMQKTIQAEAPLQTLAWQPVDNIGQDWAGNYSRPDIGRDDIAFLQYTSGSTGIPKGVMVTHGNLMANQRLIRASFQQQEDSMVLAGWLPLHHDMGLIGNALHPVYMGGRLVFLSPVDFLQQPVRWLKMIHRFGGTLSGAPNFAYRLCADEVSLEECEGIDLSSWQVAFNGAEPVRPATMQAFAEKFAPLGFRAQACSPCYGMAETTLLVTGSVNGEPMVRQSFDAAALENGQAITATADDTANAADLAGCGAPHQSVDVRIVDPQTNAECPPGSIGEILVAGDTVTGGYWQREEETRETFNTTFEPLVKNGQPPAEAYLRTGDLGFMHDGQLYVTGRLKDLIIVRGANHYPHDIERTVETSHPALMPGAGAAFQIPADQPKSPGGVVVVQEVRRAQMRQIDPAEVIQAIRAAVSSEHEIRLAAVVLLRPASTPKTTSGKIQRREACRLFLEDGFKTVGAWSDDQPAAAAPDAEADESKHASSTHRATLSARLSPEDSRAVSDLQRWLTVRVSQRLQMAPQEIDPHTPLAAYGMDSVAATRLSGELAAHLGKPVPATLAYDYPTISLLATFLITGDAPQAATASRERTAGRHEEPLAIVGIGCRFPGAGSPREFWQLLQSARSAITAPPDRVRKHGQAVPGGYLEQVEDFDARFFRMNPREADHVDPQHRLLLETVWECFEDAGIAADTLAGSRTGVFTGAGSNDYMRLQTAAGVDAGGYTATGNSLAMAANRISYTFDFRGPSLTIDTACSSSLVAVHQAAASLKRGECDLAVAGGVNLILSPDATTSFTEAGMLAADGVCRAFDAGASGFVRGEGCGVVLLQPLSQAVQEGRQIYAVLRGSAINQDGRSNGLTAPNRLSQQAVIRDALSDADVAPAAVQYVEAHGTGTELGDPIEMGALQSVLTPEGTPRNTLRVGAVKTAIGHLEAAAGIAGFIKVCLALHHQQIPATLNHKTPSPHIDWSRPVEVPTVAVRWPRSKQKRIAGVSSFGFGGANAHAILEEAPAATPCETPHASEGHLAVLSARTESALRSLAESTGKSLRQETPLAALCSTLGAGRSHFKHRLAVACDDNLSLRETLLQFAADGEAPGVHAAAASQAPEIVFMFSGQGGVHSSAGRQLYGAHPVFRTQLDAAAKVMQQHWSRPLQEILWSEAGWRSVDIQPALVCLQYALAMTWMECGVQPSAVTGHSLGEFAAAAIAGVFPLEEAVRIVARRATLVDSLEARGGMLAVFAAEDEVRSLLPELGANIDVAAVNGPRQTVLGGCQQRLEEIAAELKSQKITTRTLQTTHGFHSPLITPVLDDFTAAVEAAELSTPTIEFISAQTGQAASAEVATAAYWRSNLRSAVRFYDALQTIAECGTSICLETGAGSTLASISRAARLELTALPGLSGDDNERRQLLNTAGRLYAAGARFDWNSLLGYQTPPLPLPHYPFERSRHWFAEPAASSQRSRVPVEGTSSTGQLPGEKLDLGVSETVFALSVAADSYLAGHCVGSTIYFPAAGYLAIAAAAATQMDMPAAAISLQIDQPLKLGAKATAQLQTIVSTGESENSFRIVSKQQSGWIEHARGVFKPVGEELSPDNADVCLDETEVEAIDLATHYQQCAGVGLNYGGAFLGLQSLQAGDHIATSQAALPDGVESVSAQIHPALLDACLQTLAPVAAAREKRTFLPAGFDRFTLYRDVQPGEVLHTTASLHHPDGEDQIRASLQITDSGGARVATIDGMTLKAATPVELAGAMFAEAWQPQIRRREAITTDANGTSAGEIQQQRREQLNSVRDALLETTPAAPHIAALNALEEMSVQCVVATLRRLGLPLRAGDKISNASLATQLNVATQHQRLLGRLMQMLVEANIVRAEANGWSVLQTPSEVDVARLGEQMLSQHAGAKVEFTLLTRCAMHLADVLRGAADPLPLLFPGDDSVSAADIYRNSAGGKLLNKIAASAVQIEAAALPPGRGLRVLEIGAGTGSTAASILPELPAGRSRYVFTDIAPGFLSPAKERFSEYDFVEYRTLDIEKDPLEQGFDGGSFDIVVAANVLHATANMQTTMRNIRTLLNEGGRLVIIEGTRPVRWLDLTFGMTPGWWRFEDTDLRPEYPLLSGRDWRSLLYANGFETPAFIDPLNDTAREPENSVIISRLREGQHSPVELPKRRWLIASTSRETTQLAGALDASGQHFASLVDNSSLAEDVTQMCQLNSPTDILLHVADCFTGEDAAPYDSVQQFNAALIAALQAIESATAARRDEAPLRLWLATRGAVAADGSVLASALPAASAWGLWRSIALEHPHWECTAIDVDASVEPQEAERLLAEELLATPRDVEPAVAIRNNTRLVRRLIPAHPAASASHQSARVLQIEHRGSIDGLRLNELPRRAPVEGEMEVAVHASGLNFRDVLSTLGLYPTEEPAGAECTGVVTQVGPGVTKFKPGDRVAVLAANSICDFLTVSAENACLIPAGLSLEEAATVPVTFLTAAVAFSEAGGVQPGQRVLVHSAAGGVGMAAVQMAQAAGAEVFATASQAKHELVRSAGVKHVFDSRSGEFGRQILEATDGAGVDIVLNSLDAAFTENNMQAMSGSGFYLDIAKTAADVISAAKADHPGVEYCQIDLSQLIAADVSALATRLADIFNRVESKEYQPLPYQTFDLEDAAAAMRHMRSGKHTGKILIAPVHAEDTASEPASDRSSIHSDVQFREDATYVITGGLGGLGLLTAQWMARRGARHIALISRSTPDAAQQAGIQRIKDCGAKVMVLQADISCRDSLQRAMQQVRENCPPLAGVFQMAGVLDDGLLAAQSPAKLAKVLGPKVAGAWNLHELTLQDDLDYFVLFSSAASLFGSPGQSNHAAANAFLDALAHHRRRAGHCATSINWGPWSQVGAAAGLNVGKRNDLSGVEMISPAEGMAIFQQVLLQDATTTQCAGVRLQLESLPARLKSHPLFASLIAASQQQAGAVDRAAFIEQLSAAEPKERTQRMTEFLQSAVATCLGVATPAEIPVDEALFDLGLDSLTALELANKLEAGLGFSVSTTDLFNYPAINVLAPRFVERLGLEEKSPAAEATDDEGTHVDLQQSVADAVQYDDTDDSNPTIAYTPAPAAAATQTAPAEVHQLLLELNELSNEFDSWEVNE